MILRAQSSRRDIVAGAGFLAIGFSLFGPSALAQQRPPNPKLQGNLRVNPRISAWLEINADDTVTLKVGKVELGQGILTAVRQLCAEELDVDIEMVRIVSGDTRRVPFEGTTAGSLSMPGCATAVRQVSAEARQVLIGLAAKKLGVDASQLKTENGVVKAPGGRHLRYAELVTGKELEIEATGDVPVKRDQMRRYVGKSMPRIDIPPKVFGEPIFVQDHRLPGMVHGRVVRPPAYGSKLVSVELDAVAKMPGVIKVVRDGRFLGIVAEREEQAIAAAAALRAASKWDTPVSGPTDKTIFDWLAAQKTSDTVIIDKVRPVATPHKEIVEATYRRPYHKHGSIGPSAAIATLGVDGTYTIQTHSQSVFETGDAIAAMLRIDRAKVHCQHWQGSGCYGHNGADDVAADAALLARAVPGRPVRLQWMREDEHRWEPMGSAMIIKTRAALDDKGNILEWHLDLWSTAHATRPSRQPGNLLAAQHLETPFEQPKPVDIPGPNFAAGRNAIALYDFPGQKVTVHFIADMPVRVSALRGLGAWANVYAIESFIDELAVRAKADPVDYRLRHMKNERARAVIAQAAEAFGWRQWKKSNAGHGRGIAFAQYKNLAAFTAVALEVQVDRATGEIKVLRAVAANDSGEIVNPDGIANQIEGGIIQSLSWTLKEAVRFTPAGIRSYDWEAYPILNFSETPPVQVVQIDRPGAPFLGTGEASQGPTGAALANAVFDAVGVRFRDPPLTPEKVKAALKN